MKIQDILSFGVGVLLVSKVEVLLDYIELDFWRKRKDITTPIVAFDFAFLSQVPILICRDSRYGQTGATCCARKGPTSYSTSFHCWFHQRSCFFCSIILKCDNEPSTIALIDAVMHACVGVEVIPHGPPDGDHMAIGRVEMAVRELKRQCRTLRISLEHHTGVRIEDDSPLLSWLLRFCSASQMGDDPIGTWKIQIEWYSQNNHFKECNRIDGKQTEFEWKIFPGFTTLGILEEIQKFMTSLLCEPEHFNDMTIFMSMFMA